MKTSTALIILGIGAIGYYLWDKNQASGFIDRGSIPVFTTQGIQEISSIPQGIDIINKGQAVRQSATIAKVGYNSNIARLADGSVKLVTVKQPKRDAQGRTNFDRIIAKNKLLNKNKR